LSAVSPEFYAIRFLNFILSHTDYTDLVENKKQQLLVGKNKNTENNKIDKKGNNILDELDKDILHEKKFENQKNFEKKFDPKDLL
jgi:hypothetical protein